MSPDTLDTPDAAPPSAGAKPGAAKVALDVDDAPFLQEAEKKAAPPAQKTGAPLPPLSPPAQEQVKKTGLVARIKAFFARFKPSALSGKLPSGKKRYLILGGAGFVSVAAVGAVLYFVVFSGSPAPPPDKASLPANVTTVVVPSAPPREDAPAAAKFTYRLDAFMVEKTGSEGELRFLRCSFSVPTDNETLMAEFAAKNIVLRDAVYYYLHHKPLTFLVDAATGEELKQDIISIVNENVSTEKIEQLYVEDYVVTVR
ncbi:MAG: flagellar basal body-associated FliL family protein [Desulfovibrio sp.]|jgi:flagellar basal body-associated protein FliL|nr:flagellar basal body-associated FliL family protein [Desulfovibrio sp.]